ncbi:MAG: hypothetical protein V4541_00410 [Bacteroidota bacterium]
MANSDGKFMRGLINNLLYREYRGKQIIQSKPQMRKNHRTAGTIKAAKVFGKASKLACKIRVGLSWTTGKFYDGTMIFRLNTEILHCLNSIKDAETQSFNCRTDSFLSLTGFEFNLGSPLKKQLLIHPRITLNGTTLRVEIPELKIPTELKFPEDRLNYCRLLMETTMIDLVHGHPKHLSPQIMDISYSYKPVLAPGQTFEFELAPGCLCITAISLQYVNSTFAGDVIVNNKSFNPAAIVHATVTGGSTEEQVSFDLD